MNLRNKIKKTDALQEPETSSNPVINYWARLSDEVVVSILRFLPQKDLVNVSLINMKFRDVSRDSSLCMDKAYPGLQRHQAECKQLSEANGQMQEVDQS